MGTTGAQESPINVADRVPHPPVVKPPTQPAKQAVPSQARKNKSVTKKSVRQNTSRNFPISSFQESLQIAEAIQTHASGARVRRLTLFDALGKSPDSGPSRMLIVNSSRYGLTAGGYHGDYLELTPQGVLATDPEANAKERLKARFELAIAKIPPFKALYDRFAGNKLPAKPVIYDVLREAAVSEEDLAKCADAFIVNSKFLGLLKTVAGAERLLPIDHVLEELPSAGGPSELPSGPKPSSAVTVMPARADTTDWSKICFYITPIGDDESPERHHSDLFLNYVVEPAITELNLKIVRADQIGKPGMIGSQVVEHVLRSRLVIADLSFHNPNVFYELALRHVSGLPTVQITRQLDQIPFDLQQVRTIQIDTTDIFSLVPKLDICKSEIALQARRALENAETADNPITVYFPGLKLNIPGQPSKNVTDKVM